jgi:hypothetical protein
MSPLKKGKGAKKISSNISEFSKGPTFKKTKKKFGADKAHKQAIAVAMNTAGESDGVPIPKTIKMKKPKGLK